MSCLVRVVQGRRDGAGRGGEARLVRRGADEGGDVEKRTQARAPHEVSAPQWREEKGGYSLLLSLRYSGSLNTLLA